MLHNTKIANVCSCVLGKKKKQLKAASKQAGNNLICLMLMVFVSRALWRSAISF